MSDVGKNPERVQAGLKAAVHNPHVSEQAKESAARRLQEMSGAQDEHEGHVLRGYKATLKNPRVSDEAKQHAEEVLKERDAL